MEKNSPRLQENAMKANVFGTLFISIPYEEDMSIWNILHQLEMYMRNGDDHKPIEMLHEAAGRFGNRTRALFFPIF